MPPFNQQLFLDLAGHLLSNPVPALDPEASYRVAIGRAYYCCFLTARDNLFGRDGVPTPRQVRNIAGRRQPGTHEVVGLALGNHPKMPNRGAALRQQQQLEQLKALRTAADYYLDSGGGRVQKVFRDNGVTDWHGLAVVAKQLADHMLPDLRGVRAYP
jgi:hypothetical protein